MYVSFHYLLYFTQMRDKKLLRIALRYRAIYLDIDPKEIDLEAKPTPAVLAFVARLRENGFSVNEDLLHALCMIGWHYRRD